MSPSRIVVSFTLCLCIGIAVTGGSVAAADWDLSADGIETPEQTITLEGTTYEVSTVVDRNPGETITATVSAPDQRYQVDLYNSDGQVVASSNVKTGSDTVTFETATLDPGTYLLGLYVEDDGDYLDVVPVVVSGYDIAVDTPSTANTGEDMTITVEATEREAASQPANVAVAIWKGQTVTDVTATSVGETTYEATVSLTETGEHQIYTALRSDEESNGYPIALGVANGGTVDVVDNDDETSDGGDDNTGGGDDTTDGNDGQTGSDVDTETEATPTPVPETEATPTPTPVPETEATPTPVPETEATPTQVDDTDEPTDTDTDTDTVIEPATDPTTTEQPEPSDEDGLGLPVASLLVPVLAILLLVAGLARRN